MRVCPSGVFCECCVHGRNQIRLCLFTGKLCPFTDKEARGCTCLFGGRPLPACAGKPWGEPHCPWQPSPPPPSAMKTGEGLAAIGLYCLPMACCRLSSLLPPKAYALLCPGARDTCARPLLLALRRRGLVGLSLPLGRVACAMMMRGVLLGSGLYAALPAPACCCCFRLPVVCVRRWHSVAGGPCCQMMPMFCLALLRLCPWLEALGRADRGRQADGGSHAQVVIGI